MTHAVPGGRIDSNRPQGGEVEQDEGFAGGDVGLALVVVAAATHGSWALPQATAAWTWAAPAGTTMKEGLVVSGDRNLMFWMEERKMVSKEIVFGMYISCEASLEEAMEEAFKVRSGDQEEKRESERPLVLWILD